MFNNVKTIEEPGVKTWTREDSCFFRKTKEKWGEFSNMAAGFPIKWNGILWRTSEHLYQAQKFTDKNIQEYINSFASPMAAKMHQKKYKHLIRPEWEDIKIDVMFDVVYLKLTQNHKKLRPIIKEADQKNIVEYSKRDAFWGAVPQGNDDTILVGKNVLGVIWMTLIHK